MEGCRGEWVAYYADFGDLFAEGGDEGLVDRGVD
jgi:hypothetical protein